jgi:hypothetical protein
VEPVSLEFDCTATEHGIVIPVQIKAVLITSRAAKHRSLMGRTTDGLGESNRGPVFKMSSTNGAA